MRRSIIPMVPVVLCLLLSCGSLGKSPGGDVAINLDGGYRTCGADCGTPTQDPSKTQEWCASTKSCQDNSGCSCHMFDSGGSNDMRKWKHVWKPGDPKPSPDENHRCVCVKKL